MGVQAHIDGRKKQSQEAEGWNEASTEDDEAEEDARKSKENSNASHMILSTICTLVVCCVVSGTLPALLSCTAVL